MLLGAMRPVATLVSGDTVMIVTWLKSSCWVVDGWLSVWVRWLFVACDNIVGKWRSNGSDPGSKVAILEWLVCGMRY